MLLSYRLVHRSCQTKTMEGFSLGHRALIAEAARKIALAGLACTFALSGSLIGFFSGALKGQTTETGLFRGAGIGAIAGAILAVELMESCLQGEVLTKLAIFDSLIEGKIFREWVSPALLKTYQSQINAAEFSYRDSSDLFDIAKDKGLPPNAIKKLLTIKIILNESTEKATCCAVCLQAFSFLDRQPRTIYNMKNLTGFCGGGGCKDTAELQSPFSCGLHRYMACKASFLPYLQA